MGLFSPVWMRQGPQLSGKAVVAVEKISEEGKLVQVALKTPHYAAAESALKRISSQDALCKIAIENARQIDAVRHSVAAAAVTYITDPECLRKVALETADNLTRMRAIKKMTDDEALSEVALTALSRWKARHLAAMAIAQIRDDTLRRSTLEEGERLEADIPPDPPQIKTTYDWGFNANGDRYEKTISTAIPAPTLRQWLTRL